MIEPDQPHTAANRPHIPAPPVSPCPSDADLSRFIDGALASAEHAALIAHVEQCDDCREVVATVVQAHDQIASAPSSAPVSVDDAVASGVGGDLRRLSRWPWAVAAAAAAVLAVRLGGPASPPEPTSRLDGDLTALAQAVGRERTIEARLSLLPDHVPLASPTRRDTAVPADFAAQAVAARLAEAPDLTSAQAARRLRARHFAAVAALLAGRADAAAEALQMAAGSTDDDRTRAQLLADLSAAHGVRGRWAAALDAARDALARDPSHAAGRFNEALALERLGRRDEAILAWTRIANDASEATGWRDEARRHLTPPLP